MQPSNNVGRVLTEAMGDKPETVSEFKGKLEAALKVANDNGLKDSAESVEMAIMVLEITELLGKKGRW